jgi:hypothetical protein
LLLAAAVGVFGLPQRKQQCLGIAGRQSKAAYVHPRTQMVQAEVEEVDFLIGRTRGVPAQPTITTAG